MLAKALPSAEPGQDHRDAAPDGLAGFESAALAHEQEGRFVILAETSHMRALQIDLRGAPGSRHLKHWQLVLTVQHGDPARGHTARRLTGHSFRHKCLCEVYTTAAVG